jgi:hypothetical protein
MKNYTEYKTIENYANAIARKYGHGRAYEIEEGDTDCILKHTPYGWRKNSTGEYVSQAYRNIGWSNTYYQQAETIVQVSHAAYNYFENKEE